MIKFESTKKKILSNPRVAEEYEKQQLEFAIARTLIKTRLKAHMTQIDVAKKMYTSQAQVARLESGEHLPNLSSVRKYARATNKNIKINIQAELSK